MRQQIYPDRHGTETWDEQRFGRVYVHIVNSQMWREITGEPPPETPVSARSYAESHLPWFDLYDEDKGDIAPADALSKVRSVKELDADTGFAAQQDDGPVPRRTGHHLRHAPSRTRSSTGPGEAAHNWVSAQCLARPLP